MLYVSSNYASAQVYDGTKAAISIILEHGKSNQLVAINEDMADLTATITPVVQRIGTSGHMTLQQLLDLQAKGFEIASHSETHVRIDDTTSDSNLYYETVQSKIDLENMGFKVTGFIPPYAKETTTSFDLIKNNYDWTEFFSPMLYTPRYITSPADLDYSKNTYGIYHIPSWGVGNKDDLKTFTDVKNKIDYIIANNYWISINFHDIVTSDRKYDISPNVFHEIIQYIKEKRDAGNLLVITPSEGLGLNYVPCVTLAPGDNSITDLCDFCEPYISGDMIINKSCQLSESPTVNGNVIVQNNSVLIIPYGKSLNIDFVNHYLSVKSGSGILIKSGGKIF